MTFRAYLMPMETVDVGVPPETELRRRPRYAAIAGAWSIVDLGDLGDDHCVFVGDVTAGEHSTIAADPDCVAVPLNIDSTVGGALATAQAELEARNIPGDWMTSGMTWRGVLRRIIGVSLLLQRFSGRITGEKLFTGRTLSTQLRNLPTGYLAELQITADEMGIDRSGLNQNSTVRDVLIRAATWGGGGQFPMGTQLI